MNYYKRRWDEDRGDEHSDWGCSDWYFEVAPDGGVVRQMEVYDSGTVLQYSNEHVEDEFGMLADQPLDDDEYRSFSISREQFENAWGSYQPMNRE